MMGESDKKTVLAEDIISISDIDDKIKKARKQFYGVLMGKKRSIKRNWMQMNSQVNQHLLETLSYRATLQNSVENNCLDDKDCNIQDYVTEEKVEKVEKESVFDNVETLAISSEFSKPCLYHPDQCSEINYDDYDDEVDDDDMDADLEIQRILNNDITS